MEFNKNNTLTGFQKYLIDKGFKRYYEIWSGGKGNKKCEKVEDYESVFVNSIDRKCYLFTKDNYKYWWGLCEYLKPPFMFLGNKNLYVNQIIMDENGLPKENLRTKEDGYRILFSKWKEDRYDEIYDVLINDNKYIEIDCCDEKNITIKIVNQNINQTEITKNGI